MNQTYLITGTQSPLGDNLIMALLENNNRVIRILDDSATDVLSTQGTRIQGVSTTGETGATGSRIPGTGISGAKNPSAGATGVPGNGPHDADPLFGDDDQLEPEDYLEYTVNTRAALGVRGVLLAIEQQDWEIDHYIHLYHPDTRGKTLNEIDSVTLERILDQNIKGALVPIREILGVFQARGRGSLTLTCIGGLDTLLPPVHAAAFGALYELGKSLFTLYQNEQVVLRGHHCPIDMSVGEVVQTLLELIQTDNPKTRYRWNRGGAKQGLFGMRK